MPLLCHTVAQLSGNFPELVGGLWPHNFLSHGDCTAKRIGSFHLESHLHVQSLHIPPLSIHVQWVETNLGFSWCFHTNSNIDNLPNGSYETVLDYSTLYRHPKMYFVAGSIHVSSLHVIVSPY